MEFFVVWVGLCIVVAYVASQKRRSGLGWFLLSLLLSPLLGFIGILVAGSVTTPTLAAASGILPGYAQAVADLDAMKTTGAIDAAEYDRRLGAMKYQAATGQRQPDNCGRCHKLLGPSWRKCEHCGAQFAEFPPVPRPA